METGHRYPYKWALKGSNFAKNKGKVFSCFACGGGSTMGYKLAGFDVIGCCEIDPRMNKVYVANHHPRFNYLCDIRDLVKMEDLPEELYNLDVLDGSPPCFVAGTRVKVANGYKPIEEVEVGDLVLTHTGSYHRVLDTMTKVSPEHYTVRAEGVLPFDVTPNHPMYVRRMTRKGRDGHREWGKPSWVRVEDLVIRRNSSDTILEQDYFGIPINCNAIIPKWEGVTTEQEMPHGGVAVRTYNSLDMSSMALWRFVGRYVGDGWLRDPRKSAIVCCGKNDCEELAGLIEEAGLKATMNEERTTYRFTVGNLELYTFLLQFGKGASGKFIPEFVLDLPNHLLWAFLEGYLSADGHYDEKNDKWHCSSVSLDLILGIEAIVAKLYAQPCTLMVREKNTSTIEGREVNYKTSYSLSFYKDRRPQQHSFEEGGYLWIPFRGAEHHNESVTVFNLSVEKDESYTVNNIACHNCSSFSMAGSRDDEWGKEKHFREGQTAQVLDTLFFDFIALAKRLRPKVVVAENVKGLMLGEAIKYVQRIYSELEEAGYYVQHWLLNGADMGLPQARQRVFFVCLRKDIAGPFLDQTNLFFEQPEIDMEFHEKPVPCGEFLDMEGDLLKADGVMKKLWDNRQYGDGSQAQANERMYGKSSNFGQSYVYAHKPSPTMTAHKDCLILFDSPRYTSVKECCCISSFPLDYDFCDEQPWYICGMSVPPVMMAQVATRIYDQWISKL